MSQSLKDAGFLHTDKHGANVISPVVNSSDEAGQKNDKAGDNSCDEPTKRVSENPETFSTSKQDKRQKSRKKKFPFIKPRNAPTKARKKVKFKARKKDKVTFLILILIQFIIQLVY